MVQCVWCHSKENVEKLKKLCEKSDDRWKEIEQIAEFCDEHPDLSDFSGKSLMPLIREQDPEIQQKVIAAIKTAGNLKGKNFGTEQKMKAAIARYKDVEPVKPEPKHQNKADFMEECTAFWAKARKHWSEKVIEEVLDKARVNTR